MRALFCELPIGAVFIARYVVCFFALYDLLFMRYPIFDYLYSAQNPSYPEHTFWGALMMPLLGGGIMFLLFIVCIVATTLFALGIAHFISGTLAWLSYIMLTQTGFDLSYGPHAITFMVFPALIAFKIPDKKAITGWWQTSLYSPAIAALQLMLAWYYFESGLTKAVFGGFEAFILNAFPAKNTFLTEWLRADPELANTVFDYFPYLEMLAGALLLIPSRWRILGTACAILVQISILLTVNVGYFPLLNLGLLTLTLTTATIPRMESITTQMLPKRTAWVILLLYAIVSIDAVERYARGDDASHPVAPALSTIGIYPTANFFTNLTWHPEFEIIGTDHNGRHYLLSASSDDSISFIELQLLGITLDAADTGEVNAPKLLWYLNYFNETQYKAQVPNLRHITALSVEPGNVRRKLFSAEITD